MELNDNKINPKYIKVKSIDVDYCGKSITIKPKDKSFVGFLDWFGTEILNAVTYTPKKNERRK